MRKFFLSLLIIFFIPMHVHADMAKDFYMKKAFQPGTIEKWINAKGVLMVGKYGMGEKIRIMLEPSNESKIIREFTVKGPSGVPPMKSERWNDYVKKRKRYIDNLPFFVSAFGYTDDIPGYNSSFPILKIKNEWGLIYTDWSCTNTGWVKMDSLAILFGSPIKKDLRNSLRLVNYLVTYKQILLTPVEKSGKEVVLDFSRLSQSGYKYQNDLYFSPGSYPTIKKQSEKDITVSWQYNDYRINKSNDIYIIRWVENWGGD